EALDEEVRGGLSHESLRKGHGGEQRVLGLPRIETRVLHDDGNVTLEDARVVGALRDRFRIAEVVEAEVFGAARADGHAVGAGRLAIAIKNSDGNVCIFVVRVEDARGLVAQELGLRSVAPRRDIPLGNGPPRATDHRTRWVQVTSRGVGRKSRAAAAPRSRAPPRIAHWRGSRL